MLIQGSKHRTVTTINFVLQHTKRFEFHSKNKLHICIAKVKHILGWGLGINESIQFHTIWSINSTTKYTNTILSQFSYLWTNLKLAQASIHNSIWQFDLRAVSVYDKIIQDKKKNFVQQSSEPTSMKSVNCDLWNRKP